MRHHTKRGFHTFLRLPYFAQVVLIHSLDHGYAVYFAQVVIIHFWTLELQLVILLLDFWIAGLRTCIRACIQGDAHADKHTHTHTHAHTQTHRHTHTHTHARMCEHTGCTPRNLICTLTYVCHAENTLCLNR